MKPAKVTIHCSATPNGKFYDIEKIRKFHVETNGWKDVGYHLCIQPNGEKQVGRGLNEVGAHVEGANEGNIGICLIGTDRFTRLQFDALRDFLNALRMTFDIDPWEISCHYEYESAKRQGKSCPNMRISEIIAWYLGHHEKAIDKYILKSK